MVVVNGLIDFIVDYNLIFFVADVLEHTVLVAALGFPHEVFAVLDSAEEYPES